MRAPAARRRILVGGAVLSASTLLAACGSAIGATDVTITLYNGQHVQTTDALVSAFEKANPSIPVAVRSDDEDTFDAEIVQEGSRSPADVFYTENSPALEYLQQRGLLAKVDASTLAKTPAKYNSPAGDWVGVSARVSVLIYNPSLIKKSALPTEILQLAEPTYKGQLAFAAGETDFQPIVTAVLKAYGKQRTLKWLNGIKANAAGHVYPDNETIADEVNRGAGRLWRRQPVLLVPAARRDRRVKHALEDRLLRPAQSGLRHRRIGRGRLEVLEAPSGRAEVPRVPGLGQGPRDHRPFDQLRVPDRLRRDDRSARDALQDLQPYPDQHCPARERASGDRSASRGAAAVTSTLHARPRACLAQSWKEWSAPRGAARDRWSLRRSSFAGGRGARAAARFLATEASDAGASSVWHLIWRSLTATLLWNTVRLTVVVTVLCAIIGTLAAYCVERTDLPGRHVWAVLVVIPFAIPDFVVSFGWSSLSTWVTGFRGAVIVMTLAVYPLVYLPVAAELARCRRRTRGDRAQPRGEPTVDVLSHHAGPSATGDSRRMPPRRPRHPR